MFLRGGGGVDTSIHTMSWLDYTSVEEGVQWICKTKDLKIISKRNRVKGFCGIKLCKKWWKKIFKVTEKYWPETFIGYIRNPWCLLHAWLWEKNLLTLYLICSVSMLVVVWKLCDNIIWEVTMKLSKLNLLMSGMILSFHYGKMFSIKGKSISE